MNKQGHVFVRLRLQIMLTCTVLTGLVLLAACWTTFHTAVNEARLHADQTFLAQCRTVEGMLSADTGIDTQALLQFAQQNRLIVAVNDSGTLIPFAPTSTPQALSTLLDACPFMDEFSARKENSVSLNTRLLTAEKYYRVHMAGSSNSAVRWRNTLVFQEEDSLSAQRLQKTYVLIFLAGILLLAAIAWSLSRQMIRPAEAAQREQLRFFAMASHELKSPLAVISSSMDLLRRGLNDFVEQSECIQQEIDQMSRLVDDMLVLSGSGTGRWTLYRRPVQPEDILLSAYEAYAGLMEQKSQMLCLRLPEQALPMISADEQRLRQILIILLDNAHRYTPANQEIQLCASQTACQVIFQVIDHGKGIPDQDKESIFHHFYQGFHHDVKPTARRKKRGVGDSSVCTPEPEEEESNLTAKPNAQGSDHFGLGLAVANELAKLHGAALTVSDTPGGGATFSLCFRLSNQNIMSS